MLEYLYLLINAHCQLRGFHDRIESSIDQQKWTVMGIGSPPKKTAGNDQTTSQNHDKSRQEMAEARKKAVEERRAKLERERISKLIATHTVKKGETLSHIALKYYKHATPPYWKFLLEHNTEVLKGFERNVRTGMELEIPKLPEELKD